MILNESKFNCLWFLINLYITLIIIMLLTLVFGVFNEFYFVVGTCIIFFVFLLCICLFLCTNATDLVQEEYIDLESGIEELKLSKII